MTIRRIRNLFINYHWVASHWNRQVTQRLNTKQKFPSFKDFATFMSTEAQIACNPIMSLHALRSLEFGKEKRTLRDTTGNKASVLATQLQTVRTKGQIRKE